VEAGCGAQFGMGHQAEEDAGAHGGELPHAVLAASEHLSHQQLRHAGAFPRRQWPVKLAA